MANHNPERHINEPRSNTVRRRLPERDFLFHKRHKLETFLMEHAEEPILVVKAQSNLPQEYKQIGRGCSIKGCEYVDLVSQSIWAAASAYRTHSEDKHSSVTDHNFGSVILWQFIGNK